MFSRFKNILTSGAKAAEGPAVEVRSGDEANSAAAAKNTYRHWMQLGRVAVSSGDFAGAAEYFGQAQAGQPLDPAVRLALGFALMEQMRYVEARPHLSRAMFLDPKNADACYLLGKSFLETRHFSDAIEHFHEALALNPEFEFALRDLGRALFASGHKDHARRVVIQGVVQFPASADLYYYLGNLYVDDRQLEDAIESYGKALAIQPDYAEVHDNISHALVDLGRPEQAVASARRALELRPDYIAAYNNLLWARLFLTGASTAICPTYLTEARDFGAKARAIAKPFTSWHGNSGMLVDTARPRRLRVGLVSGDLRVHAVGFLLEGILPKLNAAKLELVAYSMNPHDDELTERMKGWFAQWAEIAGRSDEEVACKIHADGIDILIDLAGHTAHNRLTVFAWKPAPVQVSWLGYLASTGVPGIDYVLADPVSAPPSVRDQFTEEVWCLPETFNCFTPPTADSRLAVAPPPALRNGYLSFGSFQRMNKISDTALSLWAQILLRLPTAVLRLQNAQLGAAPGRKRVLEALSGFGIAADRVILVGESPSREDYLAAYAQVDIVLDTYPYPGVTTTGEALWMGVPTLTLGGDSLLRRIGASLLTCAGLAHWVAWSEDAYVALAVEKGSDVDGLARLRMRLRQQVSETPLFDAGQFAPQLEQALFAMWHSKAERATR